MKKILICGADSYIGVSFEQYMTAFEGYLVDTLDMQKSGWHDTSFKGYDVVYIVAGIAHRKETKENAELYYKVNRDLAVEVAKKAKSEGVGQLIFLSSMSVYGKENGTITPDTAPSPRTNYGKSKLEAEQGLTALASDSFKVCILRPPMVYGKGCKGNFVSLVSLVKKLPIFPKINNRRSMLYIDNLSLFVKIAADRELCGLYFPQNREYVKTSDMAAIIANRLGKKCRISQIAGLGTKILMPFSGKAKKAFGSLVYENTETLDFEYAAVSSEEGLRRSI